MNQKGFSLIEVMVSLLLISIGLMAMLTLQIRSVNDSNDAYSETQSTFLLQEIVEILRANKVAAANGDYNIVLSSSSDVSSGPIDRSNWFNNLNTLVINGKASINCDADFQCLIELQHAVSGVAKTQSLAVIL